MKNIALVASCLGLLGPLEATQAANLLFGDIVVANADLGGSGSSVLVVDPGNGGRAIVSGGAVGAGPAVITPSDVTLAPDGSIVVAAFGGLLRVDPVSGLRATLSGGTGAVGSGPALGDFVYGVRANAAGDFFAVTSNNAVFHVDQTTGDRTIVSNSANGSGPDFVQANYLVLEASGQILVTDTSLDTIFRVDPATGNRTIVSGGAVGSGPAFGRPQRITVDAAGDLLVVDSGAGGLDALFRVDPATGDRTIVSNAATGSGPLFSNIIGIDIEPSGDVIIADSALGALFRVDPVTGAREIFSSTAIGSGPELHSGFGLFVFVPEPSGFVLIALGTGLAAIFARVRRRSP